MKNSAQPMLSQISLLSLALFAVGCSKGGPENLTVTSAGTNYGVQAKRDMNEFAMNKVVCNPMDQNGTQIIDWQQGLQASLHYRGATQPRWYRTDDYISKGQQSEQSLFFSDLFVPTRIFTNGFATQTSQTVKNDIGENLIEYFALKFKTKVRLGPRTPKGDYEIAALADDGVVVTQTTDLAAPKTILSGDSDHPTQLVCGASPLSLDSDQGQNLEIKYYQGPRQHISLTLLWRPAQGHAEPLCGRSGNSFFFNPDNKSEPTANYQALLARGWAPIPAENFFLQNPKTFNPCTTGTELLISQFQMNERGLESFELSWSTDRLATSQVLVINLTTGQETLTASDNILRTNHTISLRGLSSQTTYRIQAISQAEDGGKTTSAPMDVTTL